MITTYSMTTVTIEDDKMTHCHTELFNIDGQDHDILSVFNVILSDRFDDLVVFNSNCENLTISVDKIIQDCDEVQHILQRIG